MKRILEYLKWIAINGGFAYIGYLGVFGGSTGFGRVFIFFSWINCILILLMTRYAGRMPLPDGPETPAPADNNSPEVGA